MKARVKATGVVVDIQECDAVHKGMGYDYISTRNGYVYKATDLDVDFEPDYWEELKHQYAGMAMQPLIPKYEQMRQDWINGEFEDGCKVAGEEVNIALKDFAAAAADLAIIYATTLIEKLKNEKL